MITARYGSTRLPGKPLALIAGKPMIWHVVERAKKAKSLSRVIVATDDARVVKVCTDIGAEVMITDPALPSGTDRVAAVADAHPASVYVNIQGDEPLIDPGAIDRAVDLVTSYRFKMSTVMTPLKTREELDDLSVVKVLSDSEDRAIYFSRFPIPYSRNQATEFPTVCRRHVGLYVYERELLRSIRSWPVSPIEYGESLEQLRVLARGISIGIVEIDFTSLSVDTPEDLERVNDYFKKGGK